MNSVLKQLFFVFLISGFFVFPGNTEGHEINTTFEPEHENGGSEFIHQFVFHSAPSYTPEPIPDGSENDGAWQSLDLYQDGARLGLHYADAVGHGGAQHTIHTATCRVTGPNGFNQNLTFSTASDGYEDRNSLIHGSRQTSMLTVGGQYTVRCEIEGDFSGYDYTGPITKSININLNNPPTFRDYVVSSFSFNEQGNPLAAWWGIYGDYGAGGTAQNVTSKNITLQYRSDQTEVTMNVRDIESPSGYEGHVVNINIPGGGPGCGPWSFDSDNDNPPYYAGPMPVSCVSAEATPRVNIFHKPTECNDGIDNDSDGDIDFPADPGCTSIDDDDEEGEAILVVSECATSAPLEPGPAQATVITPKGLFSPSLSSPATFRFDPGSTGALTHTNFDAEEGYVYHIAYRYGGEGRWNRTDQTLPGQEKTLDLFFEPGEFAEACVDYEEAPPLTPPTVDLKVNGEDGDAEGKVYVHQSEIPYTITWTSEGADFCPQQPWMNGSSSFGGSSEGTSSQWLYYSCDNEGGSDSDSIEVVVTQTRPPVSTSITASNPLLCLDSGPTSSVVSWHARHADQCRIQLIRDGQVVRTFNNVPLSSFDEVTPPLTTTYRFGCIQDGQDWDQAVVDSTTVYVEQSCNATVRVRGVGELPRDLSGELITEGFDFTLSSPLWSYRGRITESGNQGMQIFPVSLGGDDTEESAWFTPKQLLTWIVDTVGAAENLRVTITPDDIRGYDYEVGYSLNGGGTQSGTSALITAGDVLTFGVRYTENVTNLTCSWIDFEIDTRGPLDPGEEFTLSWNSDFSGVYLTAGGEWGGRRMFPGSQVLNAPLTSGQYTYSLAARDGEGNIIGGCLENIDVTVGDSNSFALVSGNDIVLEGTLGDSTKTTIRVVPRGDFSDTVDLAVNNSSLPSELQDVDFTFIDSSLDSTEYGEGSAFYATVDTRVATGIYPIEIVGTSSSTTSSTFVNFTVKNITDPDITEF